MHTDAHQGEHARKKYDKCVALHGIAASQNRSHDRHPEERATQETARPTHPALVFLLVRACTSVVEFIAMRLEVAQYACDTAMHLSPAKGKRIRWAAFFRRLRRRAPMLQMRSGTRHRHYCIIHICNKRSKTTSIALARASSRRRCPKGFRELALDFVYQLRASGLALDSQRSQWCRHHATAVGRMIDAADQPIGFEAVDQLRDVRTNAGHLRGTLGKASAPRRRERGRSTRQIWPATAPRYPVHPRDASRRFRPRA